MGSSSLGARDCLRGVFLYPLCPQPKASGAGGPFLRPALCWACMCAHVCVCACVHVWSWTPRWSGLKRCHPMRREGRRWGRCWQNAHTLGEGGDWPAGFGGTMLPLCAAPLCQVGRGVPSPACPQFTDRETEAQKGQTEELGRDGARTRILASPASPLCRPRGTSQSTPWESPLVFGHHWSQSAAARSFSCHRERSLPRLAWRQKAGWGPVRQRPPDQSCLWKPCQQVPERGGLGGLPKFRQ